MSGSILASYVAELLALDSQQQKAALSHLSQYKAAPAPAPYKAQFPVYPPGFAPPGLSPSDLACGGGALKDADRRRGSIASTTASVSSSAYSSVDNSGDHSDAASEASDPTVPEAVAEAVLRGSLKSLEPLRSTLKLANIPRRCGKEELLEAIEAAGFGDAYDFFYLPLGPQSKKNHGYAFINFKTNEAADEFSRVFAGYPIRAKFLEVAPAPLQGLAQNIDHFSKTQATKGGWMPNVVLKV